MTSKLFDYQAFPFFGTYQAGAYVRDAHQRFQRVCHFVACPDAYREPQRQHPDPEPQRLEAVGHPGHGQPPDRRPHLRVILSRSPSGTPRPTSCAAALDAVTHPLQGKGTGKFGDLTTQPDSNYVYDALGRLVIDKSENYRIVYDAYDKVAEVRTLDQGKPIVRFVYDDGGHRVQKIAYTEAGAIEAVTYYFRDAEGNALGVYTQTGTTGPLTLKEHTVYSSGRLGLYYRQTNTFSYELKDHLGNVRAVVNRRVVDETNPPADPAPILAYLADYYPFGWLMPDRKVLEYRYGYQGNEEDPETGWTAFQLRMYDGRVGRWMSFDPAKQYASPYLAMGNAPIKSIDPDGGRTKNSGSDGGNPPGINLWALLKSAWLALPFQLSNSAKEAVTIAANSTLDATTYTDFNDGFVVLTFTLTGGREGYHINGDPATDADYAVALGGLAIPFASGSGAQKSIKYLVDGPNVYVMGPHREVQSLISDPTQAHHIIQDAAVKDLDGYSYSGAISIGLEGPAYKIDTPHGQATLAQRNSSRGGTFADELNVAYTALRNAGLSRRATLEAIQEAKKSFAAFGVQDATATRVPYPRPGWNY